MAETTVVMIGARIFVSEEDVEALENRSHQLIKKAREARLHFYWGSPGEGRYCLMVGKILAKLGVENEASLEIPSTAIDELVSEVREAFENAGIRESANLIAQYFPD
ncbi:MAG TPA: hypothetical protein VGN57_05045 [Pirellulaceae bacterium]|jgi:hypothetical protein|nr:hypothetical protein [Pirellulaceae bacterium]